MIDFGREVCGFLPASERREWLVTNGIGGFACGTIAGVHTRRYQGLLIAVLTPPLGRTVLVSKLEEIVTYDRREYELSANRWEGESIRPTGFDYIERFRLEGTTPVWTYACADALIEKRIWMQREANTTYVCYDLIRASQPLTLNLKALVNYRDFHVTTRADSWVMPINPVANGLKIIATPEAIPFYVLSDRAVATPQHEWYENYDLSIERERGFSDHLDANLYAGLFTITLQPGESCTVVATTKEVVSLDGRAAYAQQQAYEQKLIEQAQISPDDSAARQLILAADQFIVERSTAANPHGRTIIAGYPWFGDWGRDTMISLPGLTVSTRRYHEAASILRTFAQYVDQGMLPNRFPDEGEIPEYNTVDATLWYFEAIRAYFAASNDLALVRELFPVLQNIVEWHLKGTRYSIQVDPDDGLLYSGEAGVQLTWMDAKIGDWVVTPRTGKAVEINALWYNALRSMEQFCLALGDPSTQYRALADQVQVSFGKFWNADLGYCYDVIDTSDSVDVSLRPNQLFAVSLTHSALSEAQQRAVVEVCSRSLVTSHGLRSLTPDHPDYAGTYQGDSFARDSIYHQGTVWGWLIGTFVSAHLRVYGDRALARSFLQPLIRHLHERGSISEIFDGDPPFTPRGCFAQAWSVAELLRVWLETAES